MSNDKSDIVSDSLLLLELALVVGRLFEFGLERRCQEFLRILMARKNLSYGAVWVRNSAMRRDGDDDKIQLVSALPEILASVREISIRHPGMAVLREDRFHVVRDTDPGFRTQILESNIDTGSFASFKLGDIGVLRLHSTKQSSFSKREINQLFSVIEIFAISIEGALSQLLLEEEAKERKLIEERLHQAQKMEAVGQLTGGVAHDFNNLLGVIVGNLDFLDESLGNDPDNRKLVATALRAALRGAELTSRLLAFSRKQPLNPVIVDLNTLISGMTELLKRTLGETVAVRIVTLENLKEVEIDPGQLETALLNLALNARHAMPDGGQLTIETGNVELDREYAENYTEIAPGTYAMLAVSDSGTGMSSTVLEQAFDPFFTTKEVGQGSGLGLSMVYGFVKQSGGHISIYSEEGKGTTVKLYFPVSEAGAMQMKSVLERDAVPRGAGETVLIVEDDAGLRDIAIEIVSSLGYKVEAAPDGPSALAILDEGVPIDVLLTDVVLPGGMNGVALATAALQRRPSLHVLYTSGYTENAILHNGVIDGSVKLLDKPYRRKDIAQRLQQALEV